MYKQIYTKLQETQGFGRWEFEYNNIVQCVFPVGQLKHFDWITTQFMEQFNLHDDHLIGAETIPANSKLDPHIDHIRKSNLLVNVGDNDAVIFHSNNNVTEHVVISPNDMFLLNTRKLHGSENKHDYDYQFLTINLKTDYEKARIHFNV